MIVRDQVYTIDDVWQLSHQLANEAERYFLIDGELFVTMSPGELHGILPARSRAYWVTSLPSLI